MLTPKVDTISHDGASPHAPAPQPPAPGQPGYAIEPSSWVESSAPDIEAPAKLDPAPAGE